MNYGLKKLKGKRFKDINDRLNKIRKEDVRTFLLKYGYFPESQFYQVIFSAQMAWRKKQT